MRHGVVVQLNISRQHETGQCWALISRVANCSFSPISSWPACLHVGEGMSKKEEEAEGRSLSRGQAPKASASFGSTLRLLPQMHLHVRSSLR